MVRIPRKVEVAGPGGVLALLVLDGPLFGPGQARSEIGPGGLWLSVPELSFPGRPGLRQRGFVGFAFDRGTVERIGVEPGQDGNLMLGPLSRVVLDLELVPPPAPPPPGGLRGPNALTDLVGADADALAVRTPARVTVELRAAASTFPFVDEVSASVYGNDLTVGPTGGQPMAVDIGGPAVIVGGDSPAAEIGVASCLSTDFTVSGAAPVGPAGWCLRVVDVPAAELGHPAGAGGLGIKLDAGWSARFGTASGPTPLADVAFLAEPGSLTVFGHTAARTRRERFRLWDAPPASDAVPAPPARPSDLEVTSPPGTPVLAVITPGRERVVTFGSGAANLDRPVAAEGTRLPLAYRSTVAAFVDDASGRRAVVVGRAPESGPERAIALENALVGVRPSDVLVFGATPAGPGPGGPDAVAGWEGAMVLAFPLGAVVPTLPDPYAASFTAPRIIDTRVSGVLLVPLRLTGGDVPELRFRVGGDPVFLETSGDGANDQGQGGIGITLLDLSSRADQFGVTVVSGLQRGEEPLVVAIERQSLVVPERHAAVYALPGISWEPVVNSQSSPVDWADASSPDDGPPTLLLATGVDLVPVAPLRLVPELQRAASSARALGQFTLPFGLVASLESDPQQVPARAPRFDLVEAAFSGGMASGLQLSITARSGLVGSASLPGTTATEFKITPPVGGGAYGDRILGNDDALDAAQFFNAQFNEGATAEIPVERIDLSGYGTSMFSDWRIEDDGFVGVVRARFDVLVGRTAFEVVQLQTLICPQCIRMTKTIIFERFDTGLVVRFETAWKAVSDGAFSRLGPGQVVKGAVDRLTNVHNIVVGTGAPITFPSPDLPNYTPAPPPPAPPNAPPPPPKVPPATPRTCDFVPVFFDADVVMDPSKVTTTTNGKVSDRVAGTHVAGWAQRTIGYAASAAEILALMSRLPQGVSGTIGCVVNVGPHDPANTQFAMNVSSVRAAATSVTSGSLPKAVAVALQGTPRLPRDGAWTVTRRARGAQTPTAVHPGAAVPLVLATGAGPAQWRLLEPADALSAADPDTVYGVMQGAGTSKTLFEHPIVRNDGRALDIEAAHAPNVADVGALLGSSDVFPNLGAGLRLLGAPNPLDLGPDGFKQAYHQSLAAVPDRTIFSLGIIRLVLEYKGATLDFVLDPAASPRWSLAITGLRFAVVVDGFGPGNLLTFTGDFAGNELDKPGVKNLQVDYGPALSLVKDIFSGLSELIKAVGGDVRLDVGFSGNHLSVRNYLAVPTIPLGFGEIRDITLDLGFDATIPTSAEFHVGVGSKEKPFTWLVSPLSGTGALVLGTRAGDLEVFVEAGLGVGLAINLAVASGSASITLQLAIAISPARIAVTASLLGQAEVSVLGGVASASLTLCASITMVPLPAVTFPPTEIEMTAAVAVGIHISICWIIDIDFEGSWAFTQTVPVAL